MSEAPDRSRRAYKPVSPEYYEQKRASFTGMVIRAARGDAEPLCKYFRRGPRQLSADDCDALVWLIEQKVPRTGRPRGSRNPKNEAIACANYLLRVGLDAWCKKHDRQRPSTKGPNQPPWEMLIKRAIEFAEQIVPEMRGKIGEEAVRGFDETPTRAMVEFGLEFMPKARSEMIQLAQK
jgi:hypothetical protein